MGLSLISQCIILNCLFLLLLISSSSTFSVLIPGSAVSDTNNQPCVKLVNETIYPKCRITFREEGSFGSLNGTCVEDNVFVISPNRTKPRVSQTKDLVYFSSIFEDDLPPYTRITCTSLFPTDFDFEGAGALDFFRVWKGQRRTAQNTTYTINAEILLTPEATGKYIFHSIVNPEIQTSFFIFSERGTKPYMIGGQRTFTGVKLNDTATLIPCIASDLNTNVTLFKQVDALIWMKVKSSDHSVYDPQTGFVINPSVPGKYRCFSDSHEDTSTDFVTIVVKSAEEERDAAVPKPKKISFAIVNESAVCYSTENRTDLKFSNAYARNPTEIRLLETCLQRKNPYCGSHSYHLRKEGVTSENRPCPNNAPTCLWITDLHPEGLFYCETAEEGSSISQSYFTGLDKKIYTNISAAPMSALLRPEWRPNATALKTATSYEFSCEAVGLLFLKDPFVLSVKYKNGTVVKLAELVWWQGSRSFYLTTEMEEIICSDNLWKDNQLINSGIKISVTEKQCESEQYKCKSGQCIRENWRCDGDKDCSDGSDEENCSEHHCKPGHFKCTNGVCIMNDKKCNNKNECLDGSDETSALCGNTTCTIDDFKCVSGQCSPAHFLCDGDSDCFDRSDEDPEHCAKFYPQFTQTRTEAKFTTNGVNELICKIGQLPARLKPTITWWRRGQNISDPERLWSDNTGLKLSLRFENVTKDDAGEYTCVATNKLQRKVQVFTVTVQLPEPDMECRRELKMDECVNRGCAYFNNGCMNTEDVAIELTPSPSTTIGPTEPPYSVTVNPFEAAVEENGDYAEQGGGAGVAIGICLLLIAVVGIILSGLGWRYYTRRHVPAGSARMRDDQEVVLSGI